MSVRLLAWAFDQELSSGAKFVLVALADMADEDGKCWPSQACIAKRCGIARETVNRQINALVAAGLIRIEPRVGANGQAANLCFVRCDARSHLAESDARSHRENIEIFPGVSDARSHPGVTHDHTEPSIVRNKEKKLNPPMAPPLKSMNRASDDAPSSYAPPLVVEKSHVRGTRLPADWQPSAADCQFAYAHGLDPGDVADEFADYWRALAGPKATKLDWPATWRNWCRRQRQPGGERHSAASIAAALSLVRFAGED